MSETDEPTILEHLEYIRDAVDEIRADLREVGTILERMLSRDHGG